MQDGGGPAGAEGFDEAGDLATHPAGLGIRGGVLEGRTMTELSTFPSVQKRQIAARNAKTMNAVLDAALEYARTGRPVFPCNIEKRPCTAHGFKDASTDPDTIRSWWKKYPDALIGTPTGKTEFVLDVDAPDGPASLAALEAQHEPLPPTKEQATGGGGRQLFFKMPPRIEIKNSAGKIGVNLDIRAPGGYSIFPPSMHKSGNRYRWVNDLPVADAPDWLIDAIVATSSRIEPTPKTGDTRPGDDFNGRGAIRPLLERAGWQFFKNSGDNEHWTRPGKETGVSGTIFEDGSFFSFTGSAPPIESNKRYSRYALYALLKHGGDFTAAARELARQGYGERTAADQGAPKKNRLTFTPAGELTGMQAPTIWLVKPYIEAVTFSCLFAPPESLKTFVVIDLGLCTATGREWHGQKVKAGPVLYLCGEARRNIGRRIAAWEKQHKVKADKFFVSSGSAALLDPLGIAELEAAADEVAAQHGNPALLIIDTLNRNFGPGDENSTTDMTGFIAALDRLRGRLQCAILIVHHTGLADAGRGRGNSALRGALDFEFCITPKHGAIIEDAIIELSCSKCKDHDRPPTMAFRPVVVDLGMVDEDMRPITSLILERTEATPKSTHRRLTASQKIALAALRAVMDETGRAHLDTWRGEAYSLGISPTGTPDAKQKAFKRAVSELLAAGQIETRDDVFWLTGPTRTKPDKSRTCPPVSGEVSRTDTDICLRTMSGVRHSNEVRL